MNAADAFLEQRRALLEERAHVKALHATRIDPGIRLALRKEDDETHQRTATAGPRLQDVSDEDDAAGSV